MEAVTVLTAVLATALAAVDVSKDLHLQSVLL